MKRKNLPYQITYILIIVFFLLCTLFYRQAFMAIIVLLLIVLPVFSILILKLSLDKIHLNIKTPTNRIEVGNEAVFICSLNNSTIFPFMNCELAFICHNNYFDNNTIHTLSLAALPKKETVVKLPVKTASCGMIELCTTELLIYDFLHLKVLRFDVTNTLCVPVFPSQDLPKLPSMQIRPVSKNDEDIPDKNGVLSNDIQDFRQYLPGDSLRNIHWKLSAKEDEYVVKILERYLSNSVLILPELSRDCITQTISTMYSLAKQLLKSHQFFTILAYANSDCTINELQVQTVDDLDDAVMKLFYCPSYEGNDNAIGCFDKLYGDAFSVIHIHNDNINLIGFEENK